jgi:predicted amidophosphoribosyltransferase
MAPAGRRPPPRGVDTLAALIAYRGAGRQLVTRLKYRNARASVGWLAAGMAAAAPPGVDVVTWVPTTTSRRRGRGFDQAELLARAVARCLGLPCRRLLRRRAGPAQTGRTLAERRGDGPRLASPGNLAGRRVMVVDDVVTSGATLAAAAEALRCAGAVAVHATVAASTPLKDRAGVVDATLRG